MSDPDLLSPELVATFPITIVSPEGDNIIGSVTIAKETVSLFTNSIVVIAPELAKNADDTRTLIKFHPLIMPRVKRA